MLELVINGSTTDPACPPIALEDLEPVEILAGADHSLAVIHVRTNALSLMRFSALLRPAGHTLGPLRPKRPEAVGAFLPDGSDAATRGRSCVPLREAAISACAFGACSSSAARRAVARRRPAPTADELATAVLATRTRSFGDLRTRGHSFLLCRRSSDATAEGALPGVERRMSLTRPPARWSATHRRAIASCVLRPCVSVAVSVVMAEIPRLAGQDQFAAACAANGARRDERLKFAAKAAMVAVVAAAGRARARVRLHRSPA